MEPKPAEPQPGRARAPDAEASDSRPGATRPAPPGLRLREAEPACLLIADVSGYTSYLQGTELEHAQDVLADLMETVVGSLQPALRLGKLEGDAAFAYAVGDDLDGSMLLDAVDECYFAFRARVRDIRHATTCDCDACRRIPDLDLKFAAHHGRVVRQVVAGREELTGADVILVHRLLKNEVAERLGLRGYALFTDRCLSALGLDGAALGLRRHVERYSDVGEVVGYVADLEARWVAEAESRQMYVAPGEAEYEEIAVLPAPPPVVWDYLTAPHKRMLWLEDVSRMDETQAGGRRGRGTTTHCVHGRTTVIEEILDWRPFRYFTKRAIIPLLGPLVLTIELSPAGDGSTEVRERAARLRGVKARVLWRLLRTRIAGDYDESWNRLRAMLAERPADAPTDSRGPAEE